MTGYEEVCEDAILGLRATLACRRRRLRRVCAWVAFVGFLLLALASAATAQMTPATAAPQDAVRVSPVVYVNQIKPLRDYARWYAVAEACTGLRGNYATVRWYVTPAPWSDGLHKGRLTYGMWQEGHRITVNAPEATDSALIVHEVIHDLASYYRDRFPDSTPHPAELYGVGRCSTEFHVP